MAAKTDVSENLKPGDQVIELTVAEQDFVFHVSRESYNKYINNVTPTNKVAPSYNFAVSVVEDSCKAALVALMQSTPGAEVQIAGAIIQEYVPDLGIVAKKRRA